MQCPLHNRNMLFITLVYEAILCSCMINLCALVRTFLVDKVSPRVHHVLLKIASVAHYMFLSMFAVASTTATMFDTLTLAFECILISSVLYLDELEEELIANRTVNDCVQYARCIFFVHFAVACVKEAGNAVGNTMT